MLLILWFTWYLLIKYLQVKLNDKEYKNTFKSYIYINACI